METVEGCSVKRTTGFALLEIVIAIGIVLMVAVPLMTMFSGSRKAVQTARELSTAVSLAGSLIAGLTSAGPGALGDLPLTDDKDLPVALALSTLGVSVPPRDFTRKVSLRRLAGRGRDQEQLYRADIRVEWVSPRHKQTLSYEAVSLIQAREPGPKTSGGAP